MIRYLKDADDIVTLTLDMAGRDRNILNHELSRAFGPVIDHLKAEKEKRRLRGVILTSAKSSFLEGGDLEYLYRAENPQEIHHFTQTVSTLFRELESPGVPVVAAVNGSALGIGFELALACHHRVVLNDSAIRVGLPELRLGLIPGGGSVIRLLWLLGLEPAYRVLEAAKRLNPEAALRAGLIDELADSPREMLEKARAFCLHTEEGRRPWDIPGEVIPGGDAPGIVRRLAAEVYQKYRGNYPAPLAILNTLAEGVKLDFDAACRTESRYFTDLLQRAETRNMLKAFWLDREAVLKGLQRPKGFGKFRPKRIGIIGAGQMGSAIAMTCLENGLSVVLKDISRLVAERGRDYVRHRLDEQVATGTMPPGDRQKLLDRVITTDQSEDFHDCDLVVEAVFENANVKKKVTREAESFLDEYAIFGTNTVSIPITRLAEATSRPANYVGLHFFRPVEKVPLVEIVRGQNTSDETVARAFDFVKAIRKVPIVVKDDWGFFAARVQNTYILEGISLVQEGVPPAVVENIGRAVGMPTGPLWLADEVSLKLVRTYESQSADHYGPKYRQHPAVPMLEQMLTEFDRPGGRGKPGFYEWEEEGRTRLWTEADEHLPVAVHQPARREIAERLLIAQVLEALWCLHENVIASVPETNLGSIYGWGFPACRGGVIQFINDYGKEAFITRCRELREAYGPRFRVPGVIKSIDW